MQTPDKFTVERAFKFIIQALMTRFVKKDLTKEIVSLGNAHKIQIPFLNEIFNTIN